MGTCQDSISDDTASKGTFADDKKRAQIQVVVIICLLTKVSTVSWIQTLKTTQSNRKRTAEWSHGDRRIFRGLVALTKTNSFDCMPRE